MIKIGLIREEKIPADNRVALSPAQCKWLQKKFPEIKIIVQHSPIRCFKDREYEQSGIEVATDVSACSILLGIKEVPPEKLLSGKTYLFFSHTKKKQLYNQKLLQTIIERKNTLIDYECLQHEDGQRIIGFGFFAGIVGAHNGMMVYGKRTGTFDLLRVYKQKSLRKLIHTYFGLRLPNLKIAVTGSGRVAHGILEIMNLMGIIEVEREEYKEREFSYPVYVHLKGSDLYRPKNGQAYNREGFHNAPQDYVCCFSDYIAQTDVLMNGVYWDTNVPRLFSKEAISRNDFRIQVIADVTDDANGSIPINLGDQTIEEPVYGVDKKTFQKTAPLLQSSVDVIAVGNLPNELPRDASRYFGQQLIKYVLPDLLKGGSTILSNATIVQDGMLTQPYAYLQDYAAGL
ncbi:MAG TPA: NAD(P)-dependent oxidoreductase [Chitinophagaceae bacterium]|nr:NAD(P)-dependent oxidoreductase [Chitinophagaceae bacterium]